MIKWEVSWSLHIRESLLFLELGDINLIYLVERGNIRNMDYRDQFEVFYTKEDIIALRKLMFRKKFRLKEIATVVLILYAIFMSFHLPGFWKESQSIRFTMYVFLDGAIFVTAISRFKLRLKWNLQKKREISRCGTRHIEVKVYDGWFSVSQYFSDWKSGELYVRPQDIDVIWQDSNYTVLLRDSGIICTLKNIWLEEHPELKDIIYKRALKGSVKI